MKHEDMRTIIKELRDAPVHLPAHRKALRAQLMTMHMARTHTRRSVFSNMSAWWAQVRTGRAKKALHFGIALVAAMLLLGLLLLIPSARSSSGGKFIAQAPEIHSAAQVAAADATRCGTTPCVGATPEGRTSPPPSVRPDNGQTTTRPDTAPPSATAALPVSDTTPANADSSSNAAAPSNVVAASTTESTITVSIDIPLDEILTGKDKPKNDKAAKEAAKAAKKAAKAGN